MEEPFITALVNQALEAYKQGGQPALDKWKRNLPPPHLVEFEKHCAGPLNEAIAALPKVEPVTDGEVSQIEETHNDLPPDDKTDSPLTEIPPPPSRKVKKPYDPRRTRPM